VPSRMNIQDRYLLLITLTFIYLILIFTGRLLRCVLYFYFCGTGDLTQDFMPAKQGVLPVSYTPSPGYVILKISFSHFLLMC
jgi:hypothetical protein